MKEQIEEEGFAEQVETAMRHEMNVDGYSFIAPKTREDFSEEAVQQANCVASYVKRFINGECLIFFMRNKETPEKSYITIEVRGGKVVQAKRRFNASPSDEDWIVIRKWERKAFGQ